MRHRINDKVFGRALGYIIFLYIVLGNDSSCPSALPFVFLIYYLIMLINKYPWSLHRWFLWVLLFCFFGIFGRIWASRILNLLTWLIKLKKLSRKYLLIRCIRYYFTSFCFNILSQFCGIYLNVNSCSVIWLQSGQSEQQFKWYQRKAEVNHEIQHIKSKMRDSQVRNSWAYVHFVM